MTMDEALELGAKNVDLARFCILSEISDAVIKTYVCNTNVGLVRL
jgi:hypothetical protein